MFIPKDPRFLDILFVRHLAGRDVTVPLGPQQNEVCHSCPPITMIGIMYPIYRVFGYLLHAVLMAQEICGVLLEPRCIYLVPFGEIRTSSRFCSENM